MIPGSTCLAQAPLDIGPSTPGLWPRCRAYDAGDQRVEIPPCTAGGGTCFSIVQDSSECGHTTSSLRIDVHRATPRPAGTHLIAECVVSPGVAP